MSDSSSGREVSLFQRAANRVYHSAFPLYEPIYGLFKAFTDRSERALLRRRVRPGTTVVDAGANIGIYSRFLAGLTGAGGQVHSFEPAAENFQRLRRVAERHPQIRAHQAAVGETTGTLLLYVSEELNVDHRTYPAGGGRREVRVPCLRLDDHFAPGERVDFVKMDIQGYELHALRGMARVIDEFPEIEMLIEFWPYGLRAAGSDPAKLVRFLTDRGFQLSILGRGGRQDPLDLEHPPADERWYGNLYVRR